jgi:hypothetical protein
MMPVMEIVTLCHFIEQFKAAKLIDVRRFLTFLCLISCAVHLSSRATAQSLTDAQAQALVTRSLATELRVARDVNHPMRYLLRRSTPRLTSTKEIIETRDGNVARLLSLNDKPLAPDDEQKELARLGALAANPSLQKHRKDSEDEDANIVLKLLRMLPNAFLYQYAGTVNDPSGTVHRFTFRPNPRFSPPDLETQALTAMSGELRIDAAQERVIRLEGHLEQDTNYGWGILGKLNRGGWVILEQANVGDKQWRIVNVQMEMNLRVLFRNRYINTTEQMTRYAPVPAGIDYRQAIEMLRSGSEIQGSRGQGD